MLKVSIWMLFVFFFIPSFGMKDPLPGICIRKDKGQNRTVINVHNDVRNKQKATRINTEKYKHTISQKSFASSAITKHKTKEHAFIYNSYTQRRGAPKMLAIFCQDCKNLIMHYQKDGTGRLLRCYLDRIHYPENLKALQFVPFDIKKSPHLVCEKCSFTIGTPMIYKSEHRPAYQMISGHFYFQYI